MYKKQMFRLINALILCLTVLFSVEQITAQISSIFRFQSKAGNDVYAAAPEHKSKLFKLENSSNPQKQYKNLGSVGYAKLAKEAGAVPLYTLVKSTSLGDVYFYSTDFDEVLQQQQKNSNWSVGNFNKGISFYVSKTGGTDLIPVYRYRQPSGSSWLYAFGEKENNLLKKAGSLKFEKIAFYVWKGLGFPSPKEDEQKSSNFPSSGDNDYSFRKALYFNGSTQDKINTAGKYVADKETITISQSEALSCSGNSCSFNLGFFVYRSKVDKQKPYVTVSGGGIFGENIFFAAGATTAEVIVPYNLSFGINKLKITLDPSKQIQETNESNNSFEVTINLVK